MDDIKIIGKCPVTGLHKKSKSSWATIHKGYRVSFYVIAESIIFITPEGIPCTEGIKRGMEIFFEIQELFSDTEKFIIVSDQKKVKAIPVKARRVYIDFLKKSTKISSILFFNTNKTTQISFRLGKAFALTHVKLCIVKNYEDSILKSFEVLSGNSKPQKSYINIKANKLIYNLIKKGSFDYKEFIKKRLYSDKDLESLNTFLLNIDWNNHSQSFNISNFKETPFKLIYETIIFIKSELDFLIQDRSQQKEKLESLNRTLENKVEERTRELEEINKNLEEEILRREVIEKNLIKAKELAENVSKAKSLFLANISHELKTPMNSILGYSSIGIERIEKIDRYKGKSYFEKINKSGKRLLKLLEDLIDSSKSESLELNYDFKEISILDIIKKSKNELAYQAKLKGLTLLLNYDGRKSYILKADSKRIRQVVDNILVNAIKFTKENTLINIDLIKKNNFIIVKIKDQGSGIKGSESLRIFESFYQSSRTQNSSNYGAGLGLSISQKIINAHNGRIWAHSRSDGTKGAIFTFELPIQ